MATARVAATISWLFLINKEVGLEKINWLSLAHYYSYSSLCDVF